MLSRTTSSVASSTRVWTGCSPARRRRATSSAAATRHLVQRLADGGQRRPDPAGDRQVVEADHAQVLGDVEARLAGGLVDAERLEVVAREDRGRPVRQSQQRAALASTPSSTWKSPWLIELRVDRDAGRVHRGAVAVDPGPAAEDPLRPADRPRSAGARGRAGGGSRSGRRSSWSPRSTACRGAAHRSGRPRRTGCRASAAASRADSLRSD